MGDVIEGQFGPAESAPPTAGMAASADPLQQATQTLNASWTVIREALQKLTGASRIEVIPHERMEALLQTYNTLHASHEEISGRLSDATDPALGLALERELHSFDLEAQNFVEAVDEAVPAQAASLVTRAMPFMSNPWIIGGVLVGAAAIIGAVVWMIVGRKRALPAKGPAASGLAGTPRRRRRRRPQREESRPQRRRARKASSRRRKPSKRRKPRRRPPVEMDGIEGLED